MLNWSDQMEYAKGLWALKTGSTAVQNPSPVLINLDSDSNTSPLNLIAYNADYVNLILNVTIAMLVTPNNSTNYWSVFSYESDGTLNGVGESSQVFPTGVNTATPRGMYIIRNQWNWGLRQVKTGSPAFLSASGQYIRFQF